MYEEYLLFLEMDTSFFSNCFYLQYRRFLKLVLINLLTVYFVQSIFYYRVFNLMGGQYPLNREKFMLKITLIKGKIIVRVTIFSRKSASCCVIFYSPSFLIKNWFMSLISLTLVGLPAIFFYFVWLKFFSSFK